MIQIYNTLTKNITEFKPIKNNHVGIYVCGPTVYDGGHLGHGRSAVNFDVIRRYFQYKGYDVNFVFNYTDIDDKIIIRAKELGITCEELTKQVIKIYDDDYDKLSVLKPTINPHATQYINEMIELIEKMEENNFTYIIPDDGVYYDISKFENYGKLSGTILENQRVGEKIKTNKKHPQDFALWKFKKEGEPFWQSKWGEGRPSWHIECTAMIWKNLGIPLDIHGGGADLIMPHHENEIAQCFAAFGKNYVNYWMHNGFININDVKMSKSGGNFFTLKEIFEKYNPKVVRYFILQTHYRSSINFEEKLLDQAKHSLDHINNFIQTLINIKGKHTDIKDKIKHYKELFESSMDHDFNTPIALSYIFNFIHDINTLISDGKIDEENRNEILSFLRKINHILNIMDTHLLLGTDNDIPSEIKDLVKLRNDAKKNKDYKTSDEIRNIINQKGYIIEDGKDDIKIRKK